MVICEYPECSKVANYAKKGEKAKFCTHHKRENDVDVVHKMCSNPTCKKIASYGIKGGKSEYCKSHAPHDYINVRSKYCLILDCRMIATYGERKGKQPEYCCFHKPPNYIDVRTKSCIADGCKTQPIFGLPGDRALYCAKHALPCHVCVRVRSCLVCGDVAMFRGPTSIYPIYCYMHMPSNYMYKTELCVYGKCKTLRYERTSLFCIEHKKNVDDYIRAFARLNPKQIEFRTSAEYMKMINAQATAHEETIRMQKECNAKISEIRHRNRQIKKTLQSLETDKKSDKKSDKKRENPYKKQYVSKKKRRISSVEQKTPSSELSDKTIIDKSSDKTTSIDSESASKDDKTTSTGDKVSYEKHKIKASDDKSRQLKEYFPLADLSPDQLMSMLLPV